MLTVIRTVSRSDLVSFFNLSKGAISMTEKTQEVKETKATMIKFGFKDYETEYPLWSQHHKQLSLHVSREYEDGRVKETESELLKQYVNEHPERIRTKTVRLFDFENIDNTYNATDTYFIIDNLERIEGIDDYSTGATNTEQTTYMRFKFLLDDNILYLDHSYFTGGTFAMSFASFVSNSSLIEDVIEEILEAGKPIEETGIIRYESDDEEMYKIAVANDMLAPFDFEIEKRELIESLVGIEIYKYDMVIL